MSKFKKGDRVQYNPTPQTGVILSDDIDSTGTQHLWVQFDNGTMSQFYGDGKFHPYDDNQTLFHEGDPHPENKMCKAVFRVANYNLNAGAIPFYIIPAALKDDFDKDNDDDDMTVGAFNTKWSKYRLQPGYNNIFIKLD